MKRPGSRGRGQESAGGKVDQVQIRKLGLIAGNGPLPRFVAEEALRRGVPVTVAAVKEEADSAIVDVAAASDGRMSVHWIGVGQLGKLLRLLSEEGVDRALMVGQIRHVRIFAPGSRSPFSQLRHLPDLRMLNLLRKLPQRNTATLIGGVIGEVEKLGIEVIDSTTFLGPLLATEGIMGVRRPSEEEEKDFEYGRPIALEIARLDLGQTIVVKDQAVVAVEAMEGTDETIRRAAQLTGGERLTVIKVSRPQQDMRFDVPVVGPRTLDVFEECNVSAVALDAGRTLMLEKESLLERADRMDLAVVGFPPAVS